MHFYSLNISIIRPLQPPIIPHHTNTPGKFLYDGKWAFLVFKGKIYCAKSRKGGKEMWLA